MLVIIIIICHKHDEMKQGTMALVEIDMVLYTIWKWLHDFPAEFMQIIKSQVKKLVYMG